MLCARWAQPPVGPSLVLKSPSVHEMETKAPPVLNIDKSKFLVTAKYRSRVLCPCWWCYTGGGRGETVPHPNKSTETNNKSKGKEKKSKIWSSILIGTVVEVASSDWPTGEFGLRVRGNTLVKQVAMAQLEVLFLSRRVPFTLHSVANKSSQDTLQPSALF